ncbi:MAG: HD domain-containing protein [Oscillospiraceae bacterium]|nr:HD domain-containing protein [Oscillospiraceae bacterium]
MVEKAMIFASNAHCGDFRKGTKIPYIVHPMEAGAIAASITDDENVIAAAILHDTLEDTSVTAEDIRKEFGDEVLRLIESDSENKREDLPPEETWKIRKQETIDFLRNKADVNEKIIAISDKLSNIRAIYRDYQKLGDKLWERFNQKDKNEHAWYYKSFIETLSELKDTAAYEEYCELAIKIFG